MSGNAGVLRNLVVFVAIPIITLIIGFVCGLVVATIIAERVREMEMEEERSF